MAHLVLSSSLFLGSEKLNQAFVSTPSLGCCFYKMTTTRKSFSPYGNGYTTSSKTKDKALRHCTRVNANQTNAVEDSVLRINGQDVLLKVPDNIILTPWKQDSSHRDPAVVTSESLKAIFVDYGKSPFDLMAASMKILEKYMGTFAVRKSKQMPGILDCFGWCTWDAFQHDVNPKGIKDGLESLAKGGTPAKFIIIDDGWQDTSNEFRKEGEPIVEGSQFGARLNSIQENSKFHDESQKEAPSSLKEFVSDIKTTFGLKYVYVWHALIGYWGGLNLEAPLTKKYNPELKYLLQSPRNLANMRDISLDCMEKYGVGTIDPDKIAEFYNDMHNYLASQDVDGVKVDVQNILETVAPGTGGRVTLQSR